MDSYFPNATEQYLEGLLHPFKIIVRIIRNDYVVKKLHKGNIVKKKESNWTLL